MLQLWIALSIITNEKIDALRNHDDEGATAVEYGLMVALIAVVIIGAVTTLGGSVRDNFQDIANKIGVK